jgi:hypothetical protein
MVAVGDDDSLDVPDIDIMIPQNGQYPLPVPRVTGVNKSVPSASALFIAEDIEVCAVTEEKTGQLALSVSQMFAGDLIGVFSGQDHSSFFPTLSEIQENLAVCQAN